MVTPVARWRAVAHLMEHRWMSEQRTYMAASR